MNNTQNYHPVLKVQKTFGQRAADKLTKLVGSWAFILTFVCFILFWIIVNTYAWINEWDPFPFILLNLVLSCIAALQAPIILMSHNRQSHIDRLKMGYDYKIDKKAEQEIREIKEMLKRMMK